MPITRTKTYLWPKGWRTHTSLMGVINITPDSFSDGGLYLDPYKAASKADELINEGADVLDIGAQSTRPMAKEVGVKEEIRRLESALKIIRKAHPDILISVDTFHSKVAEFALELGVNWINDISGGRYDPRILSIVAEANCPYVLTHSRGNSVSMDQLTEYKDFPNDVYQGLLRRTDKALQAGVNTEQIIWDPGLGFAKTNQQNIILLKQLETICMDQFPVLIGPSRKRFIGEVLSESNPELRIWGSAAIACRCLTAKVAIIRVHDVAAIKQTIKMAKAIF